MQLTVLFTLIFHVFLNHRFIAMPTYCAGKIAISPKLTSPELFFDLRTASEYLPRRQASDYSHYLPHAISWY